MMMVVPENTQGVPENTQPDYAYFPMGELVFALKRQQSTKLKIRQIQRRLLKFVYRAFEHSLENESALYDLNYLDERFPTLQEYNLTEGFENALNTMHDNFGQLREEYIGNLNNAGFPNGPINLNALPGEDDGGLLSAIRHILPEDIITVNYTRRPIDFVFIRAAMCTKLGDSNLLLVYLAGLLSHYASPEVSGGTAVQGVSPNWLMAGAMGGLIASGPGSVPVAPTTTDIEAAHYLFQPHAWDLTENLRPEVSPANPIKRAALLAEMAESPQHPVQVYILDTVPPISQLECARQTWVDTSNPNPLLANLLAGLDTTAETTDVLTLKYYPPPPAGTDLAFFDETHPFEIEGHNYDMADHGLFIAGIIYSISSESSVGHQLFLYEALNHKGIGTTQSLTWAIAQTMADIQADIQATNHRVVINCSLTLSFDFNLIPQIKDPSAEALTSGEETAAFLLTFHESNLLVSVLDTLFSKIDAGIPVVAAAGNGRDPANAAAGHIPPMVPAAFNSVHGVGALQQDISPAGYSNLPDETGDPQLEGYWALGGNIKIKSDGTVFASADGGLLGVYTNLTFPDNSNNASGWARWSGTSFATAVVSGHFARMQGTDDTKAEVFEALNVGAHRIMNNPYVPYKQGIH